MSDSNSNYRARPGDKLDNGSIVIDMKNGPRGSVFVLAITPREMSDHPYASWRLGNGGITIDGIYDIELEDALNSFMQRVHGLPMTPKEA